MLGAALEWTSLFGAGLLAGEEFVVCVGLRGPLAGLDQQAHIRLRQALIRRLRILVPILFFFTLLSAAAAAWLMRGDPGISFRLAALAALLAFIVTTLGFTVPINQAVLTWSPAAPPDDWRAVIRRWERLDVVRTVAALSAFALFLVPMIAS